MSATDADVFPAHWLFTNPVECGSFDVTLARLEDLFDAWVLAAHDAELALSAWSRTPGGERAHAFAVYRAALDREERAAAVLTAAASVEAHGRRPAR
jgi:hypothetical protein